MTCRSSGGGYLAGSPTASAPTLNIWGLRICVTAAMTEGHALVGAFRRAGTLYRKGGHRIEASNSHADYFTKNLTAIRAESRLVLALRRPAAFGEATSL